MDSEQKPPSLAEVFAALKTWSSECQMPYIGMLNEQQINRLLQYAALYLQPAIHPPFSVLQKFTNRELSDELDAWIDWHSNRCQECQNITVKIAAAARQGEEFIADSLLSAEAQAARQKEWQVLQLLFERIEYNAECRIAGLDPQEYKKLPI